MKRALGLLVLVALLSATFLYLLQRKPLTHPAHAIPDLILMAPPGTHHILYADLAALRSSPFITRLVALSPAPAEERDYAEFVRATAFDYSRDLDRVVVALQPASLAPSAVALAEGRFDREKIARYALRTGKLEKQMGMEVYVVPLRPLSKTATFAFLAPNRIALADGLTLVPVFESWRSAGLTPGMRERVARVAGSAFFAVSRVTGDLPRVGWAPGELQTLLASLQWLTVAAQPEGNRIKVAVEGECDTPENARQLAGTLDGLRLLGRAVLAEQKTRQRLHPFALALLETLVNLGEVSRLDHRVRLTFELTPKVLDSAADSASARPTH